jgi:hypothetical protein
MNASAEPGQDDGYCPQQDDTAPYEDGGCDGGDELPPREPALYNARTLAHSLVLFMPTRSLVALAFM